MATVPRGTGRRGGGATRRASVGPDGAGGHGDLKRPKRLAPRDANFTTRMAPRPGFERRTYGSTAQRACQETSVAVRTFEALHGSAGDRRPSARRGPERNLGSHPRRGRPIAQSRRGPMQPGWRSLGTPGLQSPGSGSPPDTSFNSWGSSTGSPRALSVGDRDVSWVGSVLGCFIAFPSIDVDVNAPPRRSRTVRRIDTCRRQNRMYRVANASNASDVRVQRQHVRWRVRGRHVLTNAAAFQGDHACGRRDRLGPVRDDHAGQLELSN